MHVRTGKRGRPKKPDPSDPVFAPLIDEIDKAEAEVLAAVRAHIDAPTQKNAVRMCDAQLVVATLRAHLARQVRDDDMAARESALVIKLAAARDDAVARLWGDQLDQLHQMVTQVGGLQAAIATELAAETDEEKEENP